MNKTKIEWVRNSDDSQGYTWNPCTGCSRRCSYCYAWKMAKRLRGRYGYPKDDPFTPTFHPDRLNEPKKVGIPSKIFVCSMGELYDPTFKRTVRKTVFEIIQSCPWHTFQVLTKCYRALNYPESYPPNVWLGISITNNDQIWGVKCLLETDAKIKFISFEPLQEEIDVNLTGINWIIIGAQTQPLKLPDYMWVLGLFQEAKRRGAKVFLKNNLEKVWSRWLNLNHALKMHPASTVQPLCQEFPEEVLR